MNDIFNLTNIINKYSLAFCCFRIKREQVIDEEEEEDEETNSYTTVYRYRSCSRIEARASTIRKEVVIFLGVGRGF